MTKRRRRNTWYGYPSFQAVCVHFVRPHSHASVRPSYSLGGNAVVCLPIVTPTNKMQEWADCGLVFSDTTGPEAHAR